MSGDTILAMFSGGIDSTGVLHQLMTDPDFAQRPLIVHHIILQNRENRAIAELQAANAIIDYYKKSQPERRFTYTESVFNTTGFAPLNATRFPFDMDVCAFIASNICVARKDIKQVAMGRTRTDVENGGTDFEQRMTRAQKVFKAVYALEKESPPNYIFPVINLTKHEIWQQLPKQVQKATWYCRHPRYDEQRVAHACSQCQTCKEVSSFL